MANGYVSTAGELGECKRKGPECEGTFPRGPGRRFCRMCTRSKGEPKSGKRKLRNGEESKASWARREFGVSGQALIRIELRAMAKFKRNWLLLFGYPPPFD